MVEESENMEAENVTDYAQTLREEMSTKIRIEVLHGKMKPAQKGFYLYEKPYKIHGLNTILEKKR